MLTNRLLTRRQFAAQFTALSASTAVNPFPEVVRPAKATQGTPVPAAAPPEQQVLRFGGTSINTSVLPAREASGIFSMMPSTFMLPFYAGPDGEILPGLCNEWSVSDDGLVYRLSLDPRAVFSDGSPVTAADMKFSWEFLSHPETGVGYGNFVVGSVLGYDRVLSGETSDMAGLLVLDDHTLEVTLAQPFTPFVPSLTQWLAGIVSRNQAESDPDWQLRPLANGPFRLESWDADTGETIWTRNERWWGATPTIERVTYRAVPDVSSLLLLWENDELDYMLVLDGLLRSQILDGPLADQMVDTRNVSLNFLQFDTEMAPMEDVNIRLAFRYATDVDTVVPAVFGQSASSATRLFTPGTSGYEPLQSPFDPDRARSALAESSYASTEELSSISIRGGNDLFTRLVTALQQQWQEILGVTVAVIPADQALQDEIPLHMFTSQDGSVVPDPSTQVYEIGHSRTNYMRQAAVSDPEVDRLLDAANALPIEAEAERIELFRQAEARILDQAYVVPLLRFPVGNAIKPWVQGITGDPAYAIAMHSLIDGYIAQR